ncbi:MAG: hypothetical protein NTV01_16405, partial [Bacteroidia bacterium]|nr:hypothetical protein [Bacteroidia bacterium]
MTTPEIHRKANLERANAYTRIAILRRISFSHRQQNQLKPSKLVIMRIFMLFALTLLGSFGFTPLTYAA